MASPYPRPAPARRPPSPQMDADDERALAAFMAPGAEGHVQTSLADLIMARLRERQAEQGLAQLPEG